MGRGNTFVSVFPMNTSDVVVLPEVEPLEDEPLEVDPLEDEPPEVDPLEDEPPFEGKPDPLPVVSALPLGK